MERHRRAFEIVVASGQADPHTFGRTGRLGRVKGVLVALLLAALFVGFLMAALVLGSIFALVLVLLVTAATVVSLFKAAIRLARR